MLPAFPALYLYPLNADAFVKHINLTNNQRVKIGRQTNARTVPAENNGYFDSKVLSRQHAEVWEEGGKVSGWESGLFLVLICMGWVDIYQRRQEFKWDFYQWRTSESGGPRERAIRIEIRRHCRKSGSGRFLSH